MRGSRRFASDRVVGFAGRDHDGLGHSPRLFCCDPQENCDKLPDPCEDNAFSSQCGGRLPAVRKSNPLMSQRSGVLRCTYAFQFSVDRSSFLVPLLQSQWQARRLQAGTKSAEARKPVITKPKFDPSAEKVEFFKGMEEGQLETKFVPKDSNGGFLLVTNATTKSQ